MSAAPALMWGTALLTLLAEAASVILAFILIFLFRLIWAPARLYWVQRERADNLDAELRIAKKQPDADTKWTITDLFQHIDPDFLEDNRWEKVGDELRDALSTGRLCMWGRLKETDSGPWVGPRAALTPIEKRYWYKAYFTYFFFHEQRLMACIASPTVRQEGRRTQICRSTAAMRSRCGRESLTISPMVIQMFAWRIPRP
ncbi:hypothetical protein [Bradyrhizobium sp. AZCC 2289]|uniref:hypothetical protein n=1 Tax=Bradyrhizobium sp. AZCC 2289 TaxID=3117026 RepID=UPI002FF0A8A0